MTDSNIQRKNLSYLDGRELETASAWLSSDTATNTTGTTLTLEKEYSNNNSGGASNKPWNQVEQSVYMYIILYLLYCYTYTHIHTYIHTYIHINIVRQCNVYAVCKLYTKHYISIVLRTHTSSILTYTYTYTVYTHLY